MSKFKMKVAAKQIASDIKLKASQAECTTDELLKEVNKEFGLPSVEFKFDSLVNELHIHANGGQDVSDLKTQLTEALINAVQSAEFQEKQN